MWIVGTVAGVVVCLALTIGVAFVLGRRSQKRDDNTQAVDASFAGT
jgi:hypothetical protein